MHVLARDAFGVNRVRVVIYRRRYHDEYADLRQTNRCLIYRGDHADLPVHGRLIKCIWRPPGGKLSFSYHSHQIYSGCTVTTLLHSHQPSSI
jgi:hypothetical protein